MSSDDQPATCLRDDQLSLAGPKRAFGQDAPGRMVSRRWPGGLVYVAGSPQRLLSKSRKSNRIEDRGMKLSSSTLGLTAWASLGVAVLGTLLISRHNALPARGSSPLPLKTLPAKPILQV